eukprot:SAG31_NODE_4117_length_3566_cov_5.807038_1_plen_301_part_00
MDVASGQDNALAEADDEPDLQAAAALEQQAAELEVLIGATIDDLAPQEGPESSYWQLIGDRLGAAAEIIDPEKRAATLDRLLAELHSEVKTCLPSELRDSVLSSTFKLSTQNIGIDKFLAGAEGSSEEVAGLQAKVEALQARLEYVQMQLKHSQGPESAETENKDVEPAALMGDVQSLTGCATATEGEQSEPWTLDGHLHACLVAARLSPDSAKGRAFVAGLAAHLAQVKTDSLHICKRTEVVESTVDLAALRQQLVAMNSREQETQAELKRQRNALEQHEEIRNTLETLLESSTSEAAG